MEATKSLEELNKKANFLNHKLGCIETILSVLKLALEFNEQLPAGFRDQLILIQKEISARGQT